MRVAIAALFLASTAYADDRPLHGSVGAGGSLAITGAQGDHLRFDVNVDIKPSRYGISLGWRQFDVEHHGLLTAGIVFEGAAARPRLVIDLHADAGADLDRPAPLVGGGIRTTLTIIAPVALVLDISAYVVIDGVDDSRFQLATSSLLAVRW